MIDTTFLDAEDVAIVKEQLAGVRLHWCVFWDPTVVQLDGDYGLHELRTLVKAMELMEKRHSETENQCQS